MCSPRLGAAASLKATCWRRVRCLCACGSTAGRLSQQRWFGGERGGHARQRHPLRTCCACSPERPRHAASVSRKAQEHAYRIICGVSTGHHIARVQHHTLLVSGTDYVVLVVARA
eukprot:2679317-Rhodomonas_salina.4